MSKAKSSQSQPSIVTATPSKRFFVEMLTRDIALDDAILDLLDNCVDGVLRSSRGKEEHGKPYNGYWAEIELSEEGFRIRDNCGGIERGLAEKYAFMMGRPRVDIDPDLPTVGMYGIGMKRAIFKMGRQATVTSHTKPLSFEVKISPDWLDNDDEWELRLQPLPGKSSVHGTTIHIEELHPGIREQFNPKSDFAQELKAKIASHYSFIIHKGFSVKVNGSPVRARPLQLLATVQNEVLENDAVSPFMYEGEVDGVNVRLFVGFYQATPTFDDEEDELEVKQSADNAGWTIVCNDRVVVYCDKTRLTGWGEATVPSFHPQFNAIAGLVIFSSNDALKLPITTTKRGIDASSNTYLYVKDFMRQGTKLFTSYTNKWKAKSKAEREPEKLAKSVDVLELKGRVPPGRWTKVKNRATELKFEPTLPSPPVVQTERIIRFSKPVAHIKRVANFLFEDPEVSPGEVGGACFDRVLKEAKK